MTEEHEATVTVLRPVRSANPTEPKQPPTTAATAAIEWGRWEPTPVTTHLDQSCAMCLFEGPLLARFGTTPQAAQRTRRLVGRSKITEGRRPVAVTELQAARRAKTHYAVRCQSCGEETVYLMDTWSEVKELYQPPDFVHAKHSRRNPPEQPALFELEAP